MSKPIFSTTDFGFSPGEKCILFFPSGNAVVSEFVTFLEETSSPVIVIVRDQKGLVLRVSRSNLKRMETKKDLKNET